MSVNKKMIMVALLGFSIVFLMMIIQIMTNRINIMLLFSAGGVVVFFVDSMCKYKVKNDLKELAIQYYKDEQKAKKHMEIVFKLINVQLFIGIFFIASTIICLRENPQNFTEYFGMFLRPNRIVGFIQIIMGIFLYHFSEKIYNNLPDKNSFGGVKIFKISCIFIMILAMIFIGLDWK